MAAPFKQTGFDIIYGDRCISHEGEILALGEQCEVIKNLEHHIATYQQKT